MTTTMSSKANFSDVKKTIAEVVQNIEQRAQIGEVKRMLDEKVSKNEFGYLL